MSAARQTGNFFTRVSSSGFEFAAISPGSYLLVVSVNGRERASQVVVVQGDEVIEVMAGAQQADANGPGGR